MRHRRGLRTHGSTLAAALFLTIVLLLTDSAVAQTVRCESADGKVTYANVACPADSKAVRTLPPADPPAPADARAARDRIKADQQKVQNLDRQRQAEEEQRERARAAEAKKKDKRDLACRKLAKQVSDAEEDLGRAALNRRESAEVRVQRLRTQYAAECSS
jgi:hypothetical protein